MTEAGRFVERTGPYLRNISGQIFWPCDPRPEEVDLAAIAHALAHQCRWTGHVSEFYSVAQHSVLVSRYCHPVDAMWGLFHDAAEAYLSDVPAPIKALPEMFGYRQLEDRIQVAVSRRFGLTETMPRSVHLADCVLRATEARDLRADHEEAARLCVTPLPDKIVPVSAARARSMFLERYCELTEMAEKLRLLA